MALTNPRNAVRSPYPPQDPYARQGDPNAYGQNQRTNNYGLVDASAQRPAYDAGAASAPAPADAVRGPLEYGRDNPYVPYVDPNPAREVAYNRDNPYVPWQSPNPAPETKPIGKSPWDGPPAVTNDAVRSPYGKPYAPSPWEGPAAVTNADPRMMQRQALLSLITRG